MHAGHPAKSPLVAPHVSLRRMNAPRRFASLAAPRKNAFKQALQAAAAVRLLTDAAVGAQQRVLHPAPLLGLWASAGSPQVTELLALAPGLSWLVIDMEHAPNTLPSVLAQLHAAQASSAEPIIRVPCANDPVIVKQVLAARALGRVLRVSPRPTP